MKWQSKDVIELMGEPTPEELNEIQPILKSIRKTICPECGHEMIPCPKEYSDYTKGVIKPGELICELHGTLEMIENHR